MMIAGPFTEVKYLVSKQDFVYEAPSVRVVTGDNLPVEISLSLVLKVVAREASEDAERDASKIMQLVTNVNQYNELIDANIMERARLIARSVKAS